MQIRYIKNVHSIGGYIMDKEILGKRLRNLREKRNLYQKDVARRLNVSEYQMSRYESGKSKPDPELISKMAEFYEVTTDYLLGKSNHPNLTATEDNRIDEEVDELLDIIESIKDDEKKKRLKKEILAFAKGYKAANADQ